MTQHWGIGTLSKGKVQSQMTVGEEYLKMKAVGKSLLEVIRMEV